MARFAEGQVVRALDSAQGMTQGAEYRVHAVLEQTLGAFGTFVDYVLAPVAGGDLIVVGNGHVLLEEAR